jgi:hypothetical protein
MGDSIVAGEPKYEQGSETNRSTSTIPLSPDRVSVPDSAQCPYRRMAKKDVFVGVLTNQGKEFIEAIRIGKCA